MEVAVSRSERAQGGGRRRGRPGSARIDFGRSVRAAGARGATILRASPRDRRTRGRRRRAFAGRFRRPRRPARPASHGRARGGEQSRGGSAMEVGGKLGPDCFSRARTTPARRDSSRRGRSRRLQHVRKGMAGSGRRTRETRRARGCSFPGRSSSAREARRRAFLPAEGACDRDRGGGARISRRRILCPWTSAVRIRAVLFDAGATLVHPDPPVETIYSREFAADGARFVEEDLTRALTRAWEDVHANPASDRYGGVRGEAEFWRTFLTRVRSLLDGGTLSAAAFERLARHFRSADAWAIYDDVGPTLGELARRGLRLAVVSDLDFQLPD